MKVEHSEKNLLMQIANGFRASRGIRKNLDGEALVELANQVVESKPEQEKTVEITENGTMEIAADEGKALSKVTAVVSVSTSTENKFTQMINRTITEITAEDLAGITKIGEFAFANCYSLDKITIPSNIIEIGANALQKDKMESAYYDGDLASWCNNMTMYNSAGSPIDRASNFYIRNSVTNEYELINANLVLPDTVTKIGQYTLAWLSRLTSVIIPNSVTSIGAGAFYYCNNLTSVTIGSGVTIIEDHAFEGCNNLTSVTMTTGVTQIGGYVFRLCLNLTSITIPDSVTQIGSCALGIGSTTNKGTIIFLGTTPPSISSGAFSTIYLNKIIVPKGCGKVYKTATNWANFADYIEEAAE